MAPQILELKTPWPLVNVEEENGELVVSFHSESFLWPSIEEVGKTLLSLVDETEKDPFFLDMGNVDHFSGLALDKLVHLNNKLKIAGRRLVLKNVTPHLMEKLQLTTLANECEFRPVEKCRGSRFQS
jgi:anti-anti-sigma regulatory factor